MIVPITVLPWLNHFPVHPKSLFFSRFFTTVHSSFIFLIPHSLITGHGTNQKNAISLNSVVFCLTDTKTFEVVVVSKVSIMGSGQSVSSSPSRVKPMNVSMPSLYHPPPHLIHRYSSSTICDRRCNNHNLRKSLPSINRMGTVVVRSNGGNGVHDPSMAMYHRHDLDMYLVSQIAKCLGVRIILFFFVTIGHGH